MKKYQMFIDGPRTDSRIISFCGDIIFHGIILAYAFGCAGLSIIFDKPNGRQRKDFKEDAKKIFSKKRTQILLGSFISVYCIALFYEVVSNVMFSIMAESVLQYVQQFIK